MKDNLQIAAALRKTIKVLIAYIRSLRALIKEVDTLHQEREKELLHVISVKNRRIKKLEKQVENYRSDKKLIHLEEVVKNQGEKMLNQTKKINELMMERM